MVWSLYFLILSNGLEGIAVDRPCFKAVDRTIVAKTTEKTNYFLSNEIDPMIDNIKYVISACQIIYLPCSEIKLHN